VADRIVTADVAATLEIAIFQLRVFMRGMLLTNVYERIEGALQHTNVNCTTKFARLWQ
jgi:hypothetical protein